eukprot:scaffold1214_cov311-Pavlova_lutheri.AAC.11
MEGEEEQARRRRRRPSSAAVFSSARVPSRSSPFPCSPPRIPLPPRSSRSPIHSPSCFVPTLACVRGACAEARASPLPRFLPRPRNVRTGRCPRSIPSIPSIPSSTHYSGFMSHDVVDRDSLLRLRGMEEKGRFGTNKGALPPPFSPEPRRGT